MRQQLSHADAGGYYQRAGAAPRCVETTAMGAAYLAGLAVGYWASKEDVVKNWAIDRTFAPNIGAEERDKRIRGWNRAVKCAYGWAKE